jgi:hypothetical protein
MAVELYSANPRLPLAKLRFAELSRDARSVHIAVAFVHERGVEEIAAILETCNTGSVSVIISVMFPTALNAISALVEKQKKRIEEERFGVFIHLGNEHGCGDEPHQFHSKLILIEYEKRSPVILVGSHNWTENGLDGHNLEASVELTGEDSDKIVGPVRQHIEACKNACHEEFDPRRLREYLDIQYRNLPKVKKPVARWRRLKSRGFEPFKAWLIIAENHAGANFAQSPEIWVRIPMRWGKLQKPDNATTTWLLLFEKGALSKWRPGVKVQDCFRGMPDTVSTNPQRVEASPSQYMIDDVAWPCLEPLQEKPTLAENQEWAVVPFERADLGPQLPLFHAGDKSPGWDVQDDLTEDYDSEVALMPRSAETRPDFQVPFLWLYPPTATETLQDYIGSSVEQTRNSPLHVELTQFEHPISPYMCMVTYRSEADLTEAIHRAAGQRP